MISLANVETWVVTVRAVILGIIAAGSLGGTVWGLWRLADIFTARFSRLLADSLADVDRLRIDLRLERENCEAALAVLRARIGDLENQMNQMNRSPHIRTRRDDA